MMHEGGNYMKKLKNIWLGLTGICLLSGCMMSDYHEVQENGNIDLDFTGCTYLTKQGDRYDLHFEFYLSDQARLTEIENLHDFEKLFDPIMTIDSVDETTGTDAGVQVEKQCQNEEYTHEYTVNEPIGNVDIERIDEIESALNDFLFEVTISDTEKDILGKAEHQIDFLGVVE